MSTREPDPKSGPAFTLIRSATACTWAVEAGVSDRIADRLDRLARDEPPAEDLRVAPIHAEQYAALVGGRIWSGPAFKFPDSIHRPVGVASIHDLRLIQTNFRGWSKHEIGGRSPIFGIVENGCAVSLCFCARLSDVAAEAGLETARDFRGRGYGPRVTAAWALAIRASGRIPLYSTSWVNKASLAVARKLGLVAYASDWNLSG